ncbi:hypothetical protein [Methylobacter sp.]|uniref:hypothetical protein n=1 Tax=Methylobacter sp. TaxID=2051955 RepID=UPI003DA38249
MNYDFFTAMGNGLNSAGQAIGNGIGQMGNGLSYIGDTMSSGYDRASGFDGFGLGSGLRSGMADAGLSSNTIDNLMSAGKWGAGLGLAGAFMGGGSGFMQGAGMGLLGGGLGSYLQQQNETPDKKGNIFESGLLGALNGNDPRNAQIQQQLSAMQQAITPRFNAMPYQPMPMMPVGRV